MDRQLILAYAIGLGMGALSAAAGFIAHRQFEDKQDSFAELVRLAQCSPNGWVTIYFPGGGEYTCTPTVAAIVQRPQRIIPHERPKTLDPPSN
jgi:hypothetical protein